MEAMVEQLELLLAKKERRIKELNVELEENFVDKEELEEEIELLHEHNQQLQSELEEMAEKEGKGGIVSDLNLEITRLQAHNAALEEESQTFRKRIEDFEADKKLRQEQEHNRLLFGNLSPKKGPPVALDDMILNEPMTQSNRYFAKKYTPLPPSLENSPQTVRKSSRSVVEEWRPEEDDDSLLVSSRPPVLQSPLKSE